jgi:hypothetical protein
LKGFIRHPIDGPSGHGVLFGHFIVIKIVIYIFAYLEERPKPLVSPSMYAVIINLRRHFLDPKLPLTYHQDLEVIEL